VKSKLTKVIIADAHGIMRRGVTNIIKEKWVEVTVLQAETFEQALFHLEMQADLLILDIDIPGGNGLSTLDLLRITKPKIKILIFSFYDEKIFAMRYIQAGANGYLNKNSHEQDLIKAIQTVMQGKRYISQELNDNLLDMLANNEQGKDPLRLLSKRELEVALHLAQGMRVLEISKKLNLQMGTVSTYKIRTFEKLGVKSIVELAEKFKLHSLLSKSSCVK
jgi:two-component system invasion response regulator UvrY